MSSSNTFDAVKVIIYDSKGQLLLQLRDSMGKNIHNKSTFTCFGGIVEKGESHIDAAIREVEEETNIKLRAGDLVRFGTYPMTSRNANTHVFTAYITQLPKLNTVHEGSGFLVLTLDSFLLTKLPISADAGAYLIDFRDKILTISGKKVTSRHELDEV